MLVVRSRYWFLFVCLLEAGVLLAAQVIGSELLLLLCLVCFLVIVTLSAAQGMVMPVLLFFLPFSPLLKLQPGTFSLYTIALFIVYIVCLMKGLQGVNANHILPGLLLIALCVSVKSFCEYSIDNNFVFVAASLLLVPFLRKDLKGQYDFYWLTLFFSLGIVVAALTAQYFVKFPNIARYIRVLEESTTIRRAGYYGDPNFYAAHISAALSGILLLLVANRDKAKKIIAPALLMVLLLYCGFLSVSKSFLLITLCTFLIWVVGCFFEKGKLSTKLTLFFVILVGVSFLLSSTLFTDLMDMMLVRFLKSKSLSDLTTKRIDLWAQYFWTLKEDLTLLFFGRGATKIWVNGRAPHNTVIQMIYQFGFLGCTFLVGWFICHIKEMLGHMKVGSKNFIWLCLLLMGTIGPWMALDLLFFDEFFLIPIYICSGILFLSKEKNFGERYVD